MPFAGQESTEMHVGKVTSAASSPRSRHLPVAVTEGNLTENLNKTGVRLWA
jgi:hypothetical protein